MRPLLVIRHLLVSALCVASIGCVSADARRSAIRWNLQQRLNVPREANGVRTLALLSQSSKELSQMMDCYPSPSAESLVGVWQGINKGIGPAAAGLHQDVKVFKQCDTHVEGYNILVEQVTVEELLCSGWMPKRDRFTDLPRKIGRFQVIQSRPHGNQHYHLVLDYKNDANRLLDPTRYILDELVEIEPGLILGRAYASIGPVKIPLAYFALQKTPSAPDHDSSTACDAIETSERDDRPLDAATPDNLR